MGEIGQIFLNLGEYSGPILIGLLVGVWLFGRFLKLNLKEKRKRKCAVWRRCRLPPCQVRALRPVCHRGDGAVLENADRDQKAGQVQAGCHAALEQAHEPVRRRFGKHGRAA